MLNNIRRRIPVILDGELISNRGNCTAIINNISKNGIYAKIPISERGKDYPFNSNIFFLKLQLPSGELVNLSCKKRWSYHISPGSFIEHIGIEVLNPPHKYERYYQSLVFRHFNWQ